VTSDKIMKLANSCAGWHWMDEAHIQRFASLVAAAEREACAKLAEGLPMQQEIDVRDQCAAAIRARK